MHAYLIIGGREKEIGRAINNLVHQYNLKILNYEMTNIGDARNLKSMASLKVGQATGIVIRRIEKATSEALNALLKNLEEPQTGLYYLLVASDIRKIIPTIVSRCQIIRLRKNKTDPGLPEKSLNFVSLPLGKKFVLIDQIRDRTTALTFVSDIVFGLHSLLEKKDCDPKRTARLLSIADRTKQALDRNGNIQLHLTNFIISI